MAKNSGYGRPGGEPKTSTMRTGRSGVESPTTSGNKGIVKSIPSGGGDGLSAKRGVHSPTTLGDKGVFVKHDAPKRAAPLD